MTQSAFRPGILAGRVALVTGGSSGINLAIARRFVEHGASVVIVARDAERLEQARSELAALATRPDAVHAVSADVRDGAAMDRAAEDGQRRFGRYDIVIAGAAGNFLGPAADLSSNAFAAVIDIDLKGTFHTFKACHRWLAPRARLVAISAPQGTLPMALQAHACAAKAGIEALVRTLALEWGGADGARVNAVSPGLVAGTVGADIFLKAVGHDALVGGQPIPRLASLDEIADAVLFLCGPTGDYITGHTLAIDGGLGLPTTAGTAIAGAALAALKAARR